MDIINPFPHENPVPGSMGNQTLPVRLIISRIGTKPRIKRLRQPNAAFRRRHLLSQSVS